MQTWWGFVGSSEEEVRDKEIEEDYDDYGDDDQNDYILDY